MVLFKSNFNLILWSFQSNKFKTKLYASRPSPIRNNEGQGSAYNYFYCANNTAYTEKKALQVRLREVSLRFSSFSTKKKKNFFENNLCMIVNRTFLMYVHTLCFSTVSPRTSICNEMFWIKFVGSCQAWG